jgi:TonB family protein
MTDWLPSLSSVWLQWMLLHTLQTSLFVVLIWGLDRVLRPNAAFSYLLWLLALIKAFVPPLVPMPAFGPSYSSAVGSTLLAMNPFSATPLQPVEEPSFWSPSSVALVFWLSGILVFAAFLLVRNLAVRRSLGHAKPTGVTISAVLPRHRDDRLGQIPLYTSSEIQAPMLVGLLRPRIYLPDTWKQWSDQELKLILNHEVAHAQRRDLWVALLQLLMLTLFFYNPFIWLVHMKVNRYREQACDDSALVRTGCTAVDYCKTLCAFLEISPQRLESSYAGLYFLESARTLSERIKYLLHKKENPIMRRSPTLRFAVLLALAVAVVPLSWQCSQKAGPESPVATKQQDVSEKVASSSTSSELRVSTQSLSSESSFEFVEYDTPPMPVGGFAAIQRNLRYPEIARKAGIEGRVILYILIDESGQVRDTRVVQSLGQAGCDEAAIEAVKSVRWKPAMQRDKPVKVWVAIPVIFRLK